MKELIKIFKEKENLILKKFFKAVPYLKSDWEDLETSLVNNTANLLIIIDNINLTNENFQSTLNEHLEFKDKLLNEIASAYYHNINNIQEDIKIQEKKVKEDFFTEQKHIKNELIKIEEAHRDFSASLFEDTLEIEESYKDEANILNANIEDEKKVYLNRVSSIYSHKDSEEERINNKYHELIKDYHQKNKQRLKQNRARLSELDETLKGYIEFHEKDTIYAKQNYFWTITNLNNKINALTLNYKKIENDHDEKFAREKEKITQYLKFKKEELQRLNDQTLDEFVETYQKIDLELDSIRENYNELETKLRNKYNREVTSINVKLHNDKDEINSLISSLESNQLESKKEIKELNKKLKQLEKDAEKKLKQAKRQYKNNLIAEAKNYASSYEHTLYKRTIAEQNKNDRLNYYQEVFSLDKEKTAEKTKINKEKAALKKEIVELYKQLEIVPLESQSSLAAHIYNLEVNLQKLENDYMFSLTEKNKDLLNLKSNLHKHNLNKTRDRINTNHESELSISNITNYLQMEAEKNELVHLKRSVNLQKKEKKAISQKKILINNQQKSLNESQKGFKISIFNTHLENKMALKKLNEKLLKENKNYQIHKEKLLKQHHHNQVEAEDFVKRLKFEKVFLNDLLSYYNDLLNNLMAEEKTILLTFANNSFGNTNEDDFKIFLTKTKELLLLKHELKKDLITQIISTLSSYLEEKISSIKQERLQKTKSKIFKTFDDELENIFLERKSLEQEIAEIKEKSSLIQAEIDSLLAQKKYALETLVYSEKELQHLHKQKTSTRNKRLINNLNDHIEINKNLAGQRRTEIKSLKNELKSQNRTISSLKRQVRKIESKIKRIEKNKNNSLKRLNKSIDSETVIFNKLLNDLNKVSLSISNINNSYYNAIEQSLLKHNTVKKTIKSLNIALSRKQKLLNSFLFKTLETVDLKSETILKRHSRIRQKQINYQNKSLSLLAKNHLKNVSKLNKKIKLANKNTKNKEVNIKKLQNNVIKSLLKEQTREIKETDELIKDIKEERINHNQNYQQIKKAFQINKEELLLKEKETLKENLKNSLKSNQRLIKDTKSNINKLNKEIEYDEKKHAAQLNYFFNRDKQTRKKLHNKQNNSINDLNKEIAHLKKRLPKLDQEIAKLVDDRKNAEQRLKRNLNRVSYFTNLKNKIKLKFSILREKHLIKSEVLKELSSKK